MIVITLTDCPPSLRGDLTKWLQEINTGVYVGQVSARVRDEIWNRIQEKAKSGRATMVFNANNEQRLDFRVHNSSWEPIGFDGLKLMLRPSPARLEKLSEARTGFSHAAKRQMAKRISRKKRSKILPETYIVLDVETTGLSSHEHEIIEIGAVMVQQKEITQNFHAIVKTTTEIPPSIKELTGLSNEEIYQEGKDLRTVLLEFLKFVDNLPVVSHNADFDYAFLRAACQRCELPLFSNYCIDTLALSRRLVRDVENYKLSTLLSYFEIEANDLHRSINDCLATKKLYDKLIELQQNGN
ncbi:MAG: type I-E CRISPR-associated endoribonuclease Cas2e [Desulfitobacteriia bacterium]|jgi:CRISPR-associated protein Cas2